MFVSVITVTYQAASTLAKTLDSIFAQSFDAFECLIIDGASTDGTVAIIDSYSEKAKADFPNIAFRFISEPDKGLYDAMNKGLAMAEGDFVWFINAGDKIYDSGTMRQVFDAYKRNPTSDVIYGQSLIIDSEDRPVGERHKIAPKVLTQQSLLNGLVVCHQSILVRRKIAPDYDLRYRISADYDWTCRVLGLSKHTLYIDAYLSRFMEAGLSGTYRKRSWRERYDSMQRHFGPAATLWAHLKIIVKYPFSRKA